MYVNEQINFEMFIIYCMKKEDQRIKVTKLLIKESLSKLLKEKSFDKISIKELCDLADINRGTFYTHYKDLNDLQTKIYNEFIESFQSTFIPSLQKANTNTLTTEEMISSILSFIKENKDMCIILLHSDKHFSFLENLSEIGKNIVDSIYPTLFNVVTSKDLDIFYSYVSGGSIKIILEWVEHDCDVEIKELSIKLNLLIKSTINYFKG